MPDRSAILRDATGRIHDVVVIGGGINGAGIARDAALRGLSVLLLERHDYGFGTTWRSTKLIHGGLRYLEHREWRLVYEGLRERAVLLRTAPHLVKPLPFLVPVFRNGRYGRHTIGAGLTLYDQLARGSELAGHHFHPPAATRALEPAMATASLAGGFTYTDAQVALPERLCLENIIDAAGHGAATLNYIEVTGLLKRGGRATGVTAHDALGAADVEFRGRTVVNAAGPWVDAVLRRSGLAHGRLGGTRGSHLVVRFPGGGPQRAIYAEAEADGRPFFVVPWRGLHLIGTTDDRYDGDPAQVAPVAGDVEYLLRETGRVLPEAPLGPADVWYAFAGVRPLPQVAGRRAGAITRRHAIVEHRADQLSGLFSIIGGKLTSYRHLAEEAVDLLERRLGVPHVRCVTADQPLVPGPPLPAGAAIAGSLAAVYGPRARQVLALAAADPNLAAPLCPHTDVIGAQAVHAARHEQAATVADVLLRRTPAGWSRCRGLDAAQRTAELLAAELGWSAGQMQRAAAAYPAEARAALLTPDEINDGGRASAGAWPIAATS